MPASNKNDDYVGPTSAINGNQTRIPQEVIEVLKLESGMHLLWMINGDVVTVRQVEH